MTDNSTTEIKIGRDPHAVVEFVYKHCKQEDQLAYTSFKTISFLTNVKLVILLLYYSSFSFALGAMNYFSGPE